MKKKIIPLIFAIIAICYCMTMVPVLLFKGTPGKKTTEWKHTYNVENGVISDNTSTVEFDIEEDGEYFIEYSWAPEGADLGNIAALDPTTVKAVTAIRIADANGNNAFGTSAGAISASTTNYLTKGRYIATFTQFVDRDAFVEYAKEYLCANADAEAWADGYDFTTAAKDGAHNMQLTLSYNSVNSSTANSLFYFAIVIIFTVAIIVIIMLFVNSGDNRAKYDERQILEQGKAFKLGFFATLVALGLAITADLFDIVTRIDPRALYGSAIFVGLTFYVIYWVWHEAYFGLNQRTVPIMIMLGAIGLLNTFLSVSNILTGQLIENGRITFRIMNLFCAVVFLVLFATLLIKKLSTAKNDDSEDED